MIRLVMDSTCDFSQDFAKKHNIDIVPLSVVFGTDVYKENIDLSVDDFYQKMSASTELPKTSQPAPQLFLEVFEKARENKDQVIVMTISSGISGTYQSACMAANMCADLQIEVIDTKNVTLGAQVQALEVLRMIESGMDYQSIVNKARENVSKVRLIALINTLENLVKGGRLSKVEGMVGSLISIKPFITMDAEGKIETLGKSRGTRKGIATMIDTMKNDELDCSKPMVVGYTGISDTMDQFMSSCNDERFQPELVSKIGAVIGTHAGSNAAAAAYFIK
ncbi:MAG: DegV family protein [Erysipelotrichaceae bacterium]|nr:DegV family protein [Erysipelotrichaceae bacterium]